MKRKKIIFFTAPAVGHILSTLPVIAKLVQSGYNIECYSSYKFKELFEEIGATFIEYEIDFKSIMLDKMTSNMFELMDSLISINRTAYKIYETHISHHKPDLIIYDSMCSFAKNISKKHNIKSICFVTTLGFNLPVILASNIGITSITVFLKNIKKFNKILKEEKEFRKSNGLEALNLVDLFVNKADKTLIFAPKEFQPLSWTFSKDFYFVGTTIR